MSFPWPVGYGDALRPARSAVERLAAGRPFIAAVEKGSEAALLAEEHGCGIAVEPDDAHALAGGD